MVAWCAGCNLFQSHQPPAPLKTQAAPAQSAPVTPLPLTIRYSPVRSAPAAVRKPPRPRPKPLEQPPAPAPLVTLENSDDAKANAQRLLDQSTAKMTQINQAGLTQTNTATYQQASELINAAERAMADQDYLAASSLAEKASALTSQLPPQNEKP
jgi:hypothetical protein